MSEDKMKLAFANRYNQPIRYDESFEKSRKDFESGWEACAAIKDAEIAELESSIDQQRTKIIELYEERDKCRHEVAARDLMIKELLEALHNIHCNWDEMYPEDIDKVITEALANSEQHIEILTPVVTTNESGIAICVSMQNEEGQMKKVIWEVNSKALEKMLLEAESTGLQFAFKATYPYSSDSDKLVNKILEIDLKLAELNKE